jgi:LmbE family N-acetylglucosaminyl deacetylase
LAVDQRCLLAVYAHPDDEAFSVAGVFRAYSDAGVKVALVCATRGEGGEIADPALATLATLAEVRERELREACARLGVQQALCLDYFDGTLKDVDQEILTRHVVQLIRTFRPDVVITFGEDGAYGHPDHVAISTATTAAYSRAGDASQFPEQLAAGLAPHAPDHLYHSHFPRSRMLLLDRLVQWLVGHKERFCGGPDFGRALMLLAEETSTLGYTSDHVAVEWYPAGVAVVEQGEPATKLYLILSGEAEVLRDDAEGTPRMLARLGAGTFFGEEGLAYRRPRNAHVVAAENLTCLVFSVGQPTRYAGRGRSANLDLDAVVASSEAAFQAGASTGVDVRDYVDRKIAAIAAHRTQYPISADLLPLAMLQEMMGREYFVRIARQALAPALHQGFIDRTSDEYRAHRAPVRTAELCATSPEASNFPVDVLLHQHHP